MDIKILENEAAKAADVIITGDIDVQSAPVLKDKLLDCAVRCPDISIDCTDLEYIDSTGLGALIAITKKAKENGGKVALKNLKPFLNKLFVITAVDKLFDIEVAEA